MRFWREDVSIQFYLSFFYQMLVVVLLHMSVGLSVVKQKVTLLLSFGTSGKTFFSNIPWTQVLIDYKRG